MESTDEALSLLTGAELDWRDVLVAAGLAASGYRVPEEASS